MADPVPHPRDAWRLFVHDRAEAAFGVAEEGRLLRLAFHEDDLRREPPRVCEPFRRAFRAGRLVGRKIRARPAGRLHELRGEGRVIGPARRERLQIFGDVVRFAADAGAVLKHPIHLPRKPRPHRQRIRTVHRPARPQRHHRIGPRAGPDG